MVTIYITRDGDVLDDICWRFYGNTDNLSNVYKENPGLSDMGTHYESGIEIKLPEITETQVTYTAALW